MLLMFSTGPDSPVIKESECNEVSALKSNWVPKEERVSRCDLVVEVCSVQSGWASEF